LIQTLTVGNAVHTIRMTQRVMDRLNEIDAMEQSRPALNLPEVAPQLEGYAQELQTLSEGSNLNRMISEDCIKSGEFFSRQSFSLPTLPSHQRYAFQAKRWTGEKPTVESMNTTKDRIDAMVDNGFDVKATNQILSDKTAREWLSANMDEIPSMDEGEPPTAHEVLFGDYNNDRLEVPETESPEEEFIPETPGFSWFPLAKDLKSFHKIWETLLPMRTASLKTLKGMATKAMRGESKVYERWSNKERESFWTTYAPQKERALGYFSELGRKAVAVAEHRRDHNELNATVRAKMRRFILGTPTLSEKDKDTLWNIHNDKKAKVRRKRPSEYPVVITR
jgi:hypothetical protein